MNTEGKEVVIDIEAEKKQFSIPQVLLVRPNVHDR